MSLDVDGFTNEIEGREVVIRVDSNHKLLKLARPLRVRIHLSVYLLQQMFNLTDRVAEQQVRDNAAFRLFCGFGILTKWHVPDHTKIETFRPRLTSETQRHLANMMSQQAVKLGFANPSELDVDSTVQGANIAYLARVN